MAGFNAVPASRRAVAVAFVAIGFGLGPSALAQETTGHGIDYPIPATAREAYSPIGEGFESPIEPRENLKGPKPYVDERDERLKANNPCRIGNARSAIGLSIPTIQTALTEDGLAKEACIDGATDRFLTEFEWYASALAAKRDSERTPC